MSKPNLGLVAFTLTFGLLAIGVSHAQEAFPSRAVRIVVPYPAGGGTDIIGRFVAEQLSRKWRQSVTIVLRKNFEGSTVKDLVAYAKANPGKVTAVTPGAGGIAHLGTVQLEMLAGIKTLVVPYRGLAPAVNDLIAGHVDLMFDTPTTSLALHRDGKVKMIATGTPERVREFPEIPTVAETLPGYRCVTWYALVGPPQMPPSLAERINNDVNEILARPDIIERVRAIQMEPATPTRAEAAKFFTEESELWGKVIKQANLPLQ
jgi:tripartite-type tricarboxylate transporter receptor subunit TctC